MSREVVRIQLQCPLSWKSTLPRQGGCATQHPAGAVCATRRSVAQVATCKLSPLSSAFFVLGESTDLDSASVWARGRDPDVTGAPVQLLAPAWGVRRNNGRVRLLLAIPGVGLPRETTVTFLKPISKVVYPQHLWSRPRL